MFDVRIVNVDHYTAVPLRGLDPVYSDFRGTSVSQVPVIRIFGSTASGKKTCLHIHGVFPYIYVPYDGESDPNQQSYQLAASLDRALNIALGTANSTRQHIFKIAHVKGVPFYGYHEKSHQFLKIYFYNPLIVKKATDLLQNGAVCNKIFQCHEAHLPFILQFFIDYNLHGMSFIQLASVDFREELGTIPSNLQSDARPAKTTYCELEVDGLASDILNRKTISDGEVANPGLAGIWSEERLRNEVSQISQNQSQERTGAKKTLSDVLLRQRLREAIDQLGGRISGGSASTVVYPAESTPGDHVHDASLVEGLCNSCTEHDLSTLLVNLDDSIIDEQLVLSLSQAPASSQDHSLLDIMQSLAERGVASCENEEDWVTSLTQKSAETLLSQSFHCSNMEVDSILGVSPDAVRADECPQNSDSDENVEKEDCWQDSFWNGLDTNDIPQLDGALDECDEKLEGSGRDTPSISRQTHGKIRDRPIRINGSISKNPSRVSSPILIDSSEDDSYMDCAPLNIFNQERFWCVKTDNDDKELENLMLADTIAPALSLKPELYTNLPDTIVGELNTCENVDSSYENVLMRGDPSLISLAEVASEDNYVNSNLIESNCEPPESESNDNMKSKLTSEENNLDISLSTRELEEDPDGIVTSSELMFSLDYEYSTFEDQVDNVDTWETVTKRKLKKGNKSARGCLKYHCERKINENKNSPNLGKRKHDLPNNQNLNRENKKAKNNECKIRTRIKQIDLNVSKQDNVEMNNNEKESKQDFKIDTKKNRKIYDNMSGAISVKSKEDTELTMSRKIIKKPRKSGKIVDETEYKETKKSCENINKNRLDNSSNETSDDEDFKVCREFIVKPKKSSENEEWDGNASNKTSIIHADNDHVSEEEEEKEEEDHDDDDDDADLFRINLQFKTKGKDRFRTQIVNQTKRSSKAPDSSLQSTGLQLGNGPSDDKVSFPCYFFKSDGVVMRINFPSKRLYLNEKTKQCIIERRSVFQNKLFPKVDFRIQPSNLEDEFLTKEMFEEYYGQDEDMPSINLFGPTDLVHNDCLTPKKRKILDSVILKKKVGISNPCSRTSIKSNEQHLSPNKNLSQALKKCRSEDCVNVDTNSSVSLPKISKKMSKSLDFGLNSEANKSSDLTRLDDPISPNVEVTDEFLSPEQGESLKREANVSRFLAQSADSPSVKAKTKQLLSLKHGKRPSPSKARLTQNKAKLLPKTSAQKQSRYRYGLDEFELSENDINSPNKIKSLNLPTNLRFASSSPHKKGSVKAEKDLIMSPFVKKKYKLESPIETEKQSANTSCASFDELQSLNKRQSNNSIKRQKKIGKVSLKMNNKFEKYIRLYNIKPCRVVVDRLPENPKSLAVKKSCSTMKQEYGVSKQTLQCNSVECKPQLLHYTTPIEMLISPQRLDMNPDLQVCSEKKLDVSQVPFSKAELHETYQEQDEEDTYNLWRQDRLSPLHCKLSVRLDRLDQSMFSRVNQNKKSFKIDNLDGCFGEDTSSDEDVTITPARKIGNSKDSASKVDSDRKRSHSTVPRTCTPRPRYKPLKVKITKSPPRKTRALPKCMVLLKKLDFNTDVGSSSNTIPVQLGSVDDSKNPNPEDDAVSSHNALSGSDDSDIFGEILFQQKPKEGMTFEGKLEVECDKEDCKDLGSSSVPKLDSHTSQRPELKMGTAGLTSKKVVDESIGDQLLNSSESNTGDCPQKRSSLCRDASSIEPIILEGKSENANYINMPGPSTSNAQPWCKAKVYETFSSSDENEDNGVLSFYDTSVYIPGNDSDSEKSSYEIHSQADELSQVSGEHEKIYIPKIQPPTPNEILSSLSKYGLSKELNCEPFCSDISDRTSTEVGPVSLKLKSRLAIVLEEYDGPFSKGVCMYRNNVLKGLQVKRSSVLASDRDVVLIPLQRPPSCAEVRKWLKVKSKIELKTKNCVTDEKCEKLERLIVPCSPGQNHSSDDEQSTLILTPMTPTCRRHSTPSDCPPGGSLTATITPVCTPVPFAPTQGTKRRHSNIIKKSSAKLLKDFSAMSSIQENETDSVVCEKDEKNLSENVQLSDSSIYISDETREKMEADLKKKARLSSSFQIEACNSDSTSGLPNRVDNLQKTRPQIQHQFLTLMILELHVQTRGELLPDPENDPIRAIFYHIVNDVPEEAEKTSTLTGIIAVGHLISEDENVFVTCVADELSLLSSLVELTRKWDPDMFIGYEIEKLSWGYLIERAYTLGMNLNVELSRVMGVEGSSKYEDEQGMLGGDSEQLDIRLAGRIVLNVWRLLRHEVALQSYTFENIMYHVLRRRIPLFSFRSLSAWWEHRTHLYRWMTVEHYLLRVRGIAEILDNLDLIGRTSELARLFGIQFYEVLSRGSQFRVESMMLRMAKPENYVAVSPTTKQRAHMRAPESLPLIMEPESRFYSDPVIVLDFQSLYPSIIIAYNYCFSTCLGRVENLAKSELFDFGCTHLRVPFSTVKKLEENLTFSPCGVAFVNSTVRKGVLPRMLQEILETRLMVKKSMKKNKNNKALHKVLHNRQLGLKLIANVTYGYTSANFSGRMPCIEIGDSVVSKGRETLERAIALVNKTEKWGARVVYGDTDSLFVLVPGRSRAEAFHIGAEIAEAVTAENPKPVKLKLEKVYQPCILQTKKRYVGHMWESPDQASPTYDAKGIETVRRDGCPAVAKILQKSLQLLFETKDVSIVKRFILHQFGKVSSGRISIQELTFAREYRGARGYKPGACVPALELARSWMKKDRRSEPRVGERVPYVVVSGPPGLPLIRLVRCPRAVMADPAMKINADYYITRVIIPPLNRCLLLVGANAHNWFNSMPRRLAPSLPSAVPSGIKKATISQYFATVSCVVCHTAQTTSGLCDTCRAQPQSVAVSLATHLHSWERRRHLVSKVCQSCCRQSNNIDCVSIDCPVLYARADADRDLAHEPVFRQLQHDYFNCDF